MINPINIVRFRKSLDKSNQIAYNIFMNININPNPVTVEQIELAIKYKRIIELDWCGYHWGIPTVLSDDKSTVYYKPLGMGLTRSSVTIGKIKRID